VTKWELSNGEQSYSLDLPGPLIGDTPEVILHETLRGSGIAFLPSFTAVDACRSGHLIHIMPEWRGPEYGVFALVPFRRYLEAKTRAWLSLLKEEIPKALERDRLFPER
jgi:DNA-binding transcriptional LysR family regulator